MKSGQLYEGGIVTEGSVGSTTVSLTTVAPAYGCKCHVIIPDDAAIEKSQTIEALGATVKRVRPMSVTHKDHYVNVTKRTALEANELALNQRKTSQLDGVDNKHINSYRSVGDSHSSVFAINCRGDFLVYQFENLANFKAHYEGTGPKISVQKKGNLDAFVAAAGTGGTVAGVFTLNFVAWPELMLVGLGFIILCYRLDETTV